MTLVPIDHHRACHEIGTKATPALRSITFLELIAAVSEASDSVEEAIATINHMLQSGRLCLSTDFRSPLGEQSSSRHEDDRLAACLNLAS